MFVLSPSAAAEITTVRMIEFRGKTINKHCVLALLQYMEYLMFKYTSKNLSIVMHIIICPYQENKPTVLTAVKKALIEAEHILLAKLSEYRNSMMLKLTRYRYFDKHTLLDTVETSRSGVEQLVSRILDTPVTL